MAVGGRLGRALARWRAHPAETPPRPAPAPPAHRCPLCGYTFDADEAAACAVCPLARRCGLVVCPRCAHEFPPV